MRDTLLINAAKLWLPVKALISRQIAKKAPQAPEVSKLYNHVQMSTVINTQLRYISDPFGGLFDYYTHPRTIQYAIDHNYSAFPYGCDCDDFAVYAYALLKRIEGCYPRLVTLVDRGIKYSHVVCVFRHEGWSFSVDTNGVKLLGHNLTREVEGDTLINFFNEVYPANYIAALDTDYPFKE